GGAGLDLAAVSADDDIGNGDVLGLAGAVADDGREAIAAGEFDGVERLGQGADLVDLDEDAVTGSLADAVLQALGVGDEQIVADELDLVAQLAREFRPAVPVVLGQAVLDGANGPGLAVFLPQVDHLVGGGDVIGLALEEAVACLALLLGFVEEFGGGGIESEEDVFAELVARGFDG